MVSFSNLLRIPTNKYISKWTNMKHVHNYCKSLCLLRDIALKLSRAVSLAAALLVTEARVGTPTMVDPFQWSTNTKKRTPPQTIKNLLWWKFNTIALHLRKKKWIGASFKQLCTFEVTRFLETRRKKLRQTYRSPWTVTISAPTDILVTI